MVDHPDQAAVIGLDGVARGEVDHPVRPHDRQSAPPGTTTPFSRGPDTTPPVIGMIRRPVPCPTPASIGAARTTSASKANSSPGAINLLVVVPAPGLPATLRVASGEAQCAGGGKQ